MMYPLPQKVNIPIKLHFNYVPEIHVEITVEEREIPIFIHHTAIGMSGVGKTMFNNLFGVTPSEFIKLSPAQQAVVANRLYR